MSTFFGFVIAIGIVIFVHELGHFFAARLVGARVEVFSIGFPPRITSFKRGDTEYKIGMIPIGGYVKIAGMIDESMDDSGLTGAPDEFMSKSYPAKVFMLSAGVLMNFILGFILSTFLALVEGEPKLDPSATIGSIAEGYPAQQAGIVAGDRIININDKPISTWLDMTDIIYDNPAETLDIKWLHGVDTLQAQLLTRVEIRNLDGENVAVGLIGVGSNTILEKVGLIRAITHGGSLTAFYVKGSIDFFIRLFTGRASIKEVAGPVGIVKISGEAIRAGWSVYTAFIAFISIAIGFFNILPIPVLDGGHLVMVSIEALRRKPISTRIKIIVQQVGLALILLFFVAVTYNDVLRIFKRDESPKVEVIENNDTEDTGITED